MAEIGLELFAKQGSQRLECSISFIRKFLLSILIASNFWSCFKLIQLLEVSWDGKCVRPGVSHLFSLSRMTIGRVLTPLEIPWHISPLLLQLMPFFRWLLLKAVNQIINYPFSPHQPFSIPVLFFITELIILWNYVIGFICLLFISSHRNVSFIITRTTLLFTTVSSMPWLDTYKAFNSEILGACSVSHS